MAIAGSSINTLRRVLLRLAAYTPKDGGGSGIITGGVTFFCHTKYKTYEVKVVLIPTILRLFGAYGFCVS